MTKEELLIEFSRMSEEELRNLYTASRTILKPFSVQLTDGSFVSCINFANDMADTYFPEWTDRSKNDFGMFLIELFAMYSDINSWLINSLFLESNLLSCRNLESAQALSRRLGYIPRQLAAAKTTVDVTIAEAPENSIRVDYGQLHISDGSDNIFTNIDPFDVLPDSAYPQTLSIRFINAVFHKQKTKYTGRTVIAEHEYVIPTSVRLYVDGQEWSFVPHFANSAETDTHYTYHVMDNGRLMFLFGGLDGKGQVPAIDSELVIYYYYGGGYGGNFYPVGSLTEVIEAPEGLEIDSVTNTTETIEGADLETLNQLKVRATSNLGGNDIAYNSRNTERLARLVPGVQKAKARSQYGNVDVYVMPYGGNPEPLGAPTNFTPDVTQDLLDDVETYLKPRLPFDYNLRTVAGVTYYPLLADNDEGLEVEVWVRDDISRVRIYNEIVSKIREVISAGGQSTNIQKGLVLAEITDALIGKDGIEGVLNVHINNPTSDIPLKVNEILTDVGSDITVTIHGGLDNTELDYLDRLVSRNNS